MEVIWATWAVKATTAIMAAVLEENTDPDNAGDLPRPTSSSWRLTIPTPTATPTGGVGINGPISSGSGSSTAMGPPVCGARTSSPPGRHAARPATTEHVVITVFRLATDEGGGGLDRGRSLRSNEVAACNLGVQDRHSLAMVAAGHCSRPDIHPWSTSRPAAALRRRLTGRSEREHPGHDETWPWQRLGRRRTVIDIARPSFAKPRSSRTRRIS